MHTSKTIVTVAVTQRLGGGHVLYIIGNTVTCLTFRSKFCTSYPTGASIPVLPYFILIF